ncbi:MAG: tyrosine-type recombinase/integrase [Bacteroidota bacterium]|nr:tyrosine-type recombinase/integrase [Bacteroidota bacterium]
MIYYDKFKKSFDNEATLRNLSPRTRESYWWHIKDYYNFLGKDPRETGVDELRDYFLSMLSDGKHKPGSVKMGYYALKFLFTRIYHKEWAKEYLPTPKIAKTLPLVLSKEEVLDVLGVIPNFKHRSIIMFIYSTGTRISECANIKLTDIDSKRMQVNIREGKGLKQRYVPLSPLLLTTLRRFYNEYKPKHYLFEGAGGKATHLSTSAIREICNKARYHTRHIKKHYTPHTFRHCFATHLLEQGVNLLVIQRLMGHAGLSNTLKYLHVQQLSIDKVINPLDNLKGVEGLCKKK